MKRLIIIGVALMVLIGASVPFCWAGGVVETGVRTIFTKNSINLFQQNLPDINLQDLSFPEQRSVAQISMRWVTPEVLFQYRLTPRISLGSDLMLPTTLSLGGQVFGPTQTATTGSTTTPVLTNLNAEVWSNLVELTLKRSLQFQPSFLVELHTANLSARQTSQNQTVTASVIKNFYDIGMGAVSVWPVNEKKSLYLINKLYYMYSGQGDGVLFNTELSYQCLSCGYSIRKQTFKSGDDGIKITSQGPYFQIFWTF